MKKRKLLTMLVLLAMVCLFVHAGFRAGGHDNVASPSREVLRARTLRIVIDPGHGGTDVGAIGASGRYEKDFNLMLAHKVVALLEQEPGIEVYMTRTDDRFLSQTSRFRPAFANELGADLLISIHGNTYSDPAVTGTETFYYHVHSRALANIVQRHVVQATGFRDRGFMRGGSLRPR